MPVPMSVSVSAASYPGKGYSHTFNNVFKSPEY